MCGPSVARTGGPAPSATPPPPSPTAPAGAAVPPRGWGIGAGQSGPTENAGAGHAGPHAACAPPVPEMSPGAFPRSAPCHGDGMGPFPSKDAIPLRGIGGAQSPGRSIAIDGRVDTVLHRRHSARDDQSAAERRGRRWDAPRTASPPVHTYRHFRRAPSRGRYVSDGQYVCTHPQRPKPDVSAPPPPKCHASTGGGPSTSAAPATAASASAAAVVTGRRRHERPPPPPPPRAAGAGDVFRCRRGARCARPPPPATARPQLRTSPRGTASLPPPRERQRTAGLQPRGRVPAPPQDCAAGRGRTITTPPSEGGGGGQSAGRLLPPLRRQSAGGTLPPRPPAPPPPPPKCHASWLRGRPPAGGGSTAWAAGGTAHPPLVRPARPLSRRPARRGTPAAPMQRWRTRHGLRRGSRRPPRRRSRAAGPGGRGPGHALTPGAALLSPAPAGLPPPPLPHCTGACGSAPEGLGYRRGPVRPHGERGGWSRGSSAGAPFARRTRPHAACAPSCRRRARRALSAAGAPARCLRRSARRCQGASR